VMDPPTVFRTEVMCQDVRRSTNPSPRWRGPPPGTPPRPSGAPSTFTDHEPENRLAQKVCDSMPGLIRWSRRKIEPAPLRDRLDLIVAGMTSPSPSAFHIIDHLVAGAP
jgi:hypothetical protein